MTDYKRHRLRLYSPDEASTVVLESKNASTVFTSGQTLAFANSVTVNDGSVLTAYDGSSTSYDVGSQLTTNAAAIVTEATNRATGDADLLGTVSDTFAANVTVRGVRAGVTTNIADISTNATNITSNASSISTNTANITVNSAAIAQEITDRTTAVSAEATLRANGDAALLGATGDALTDNTIFGCKEAIIATNVNVSSNDVDIAANLASINLNTANITSNDTDIAANTASIDELKGDLATILDGSSINFDTLSAAVDTYTATNTNTGVLDILENLAARCTHLEGVLDELLNGDLSPVASLNDMPNPN